MLNHKRQFQLGAVHNLQTLQESTNSRLWVGGWFRKLLQQTYFCMIDLKCFLLECFTLASFNFTSNDISSVFSAFCCIGGSCTPLTLLYAHSKIHNPEDNNVNPYRIVDFWRVGGSGQVMIQQRKMNLKSIYTCNCIQCDKTNFRLV